jgi:hypothetical protein
MKNFQKLVLGLVVAVMAIGFSAFKSSADKNAKFAGAYFYNQSTQQPWSSTGALPADQVSTHYSTYSGSPSCQTSSNICTYDLVGGKYIQVSKGTFN